MSFFNQKKPDEFIGEMPPNEYDEEEYYGEEEGEYAEDEEYDEDYEEGEEGDAPAPKKNVVKSAMMGVAALAVVGLGGFYAMNFFAPDMTQELVNNLPFVSQSPDQEPGAETFTDVPGAAPGEVAPPPNDVTASADVAAVPPAPPKPEPVKPSAKPAPKKPAPVAAKPPAKKWVAPAKKWTPPAKKWTPTAKKWTPPAKRWAPPAKSARYARYYAPKKRAVRPAYTRGYYNRYQARKPVSTAYRTRYAVQVGSFANHANATQLVSQLRAQGVAAYSTGNGGHVGAGHLVRSVAVRNRANAQRLLAQFRAAGYQSRIVNVGNGLMAVSAGVYGTPQRAQAVVARLNQRGLYASSGYTAGVATGGAPSRVIIGTYNTRAAAAAKMRQLQNQGIPAAVTTTR